MCVQATALPPVNAGLPSKNLQLPVRFIKEGCAGAWRARKAWSMSCVVAAAAARDDAWPCSTHGELRLQAPALPQLGQLDNLDGVVRGLVMSVSVAYMVNETKARPGWSLPSLLKKSTRKSLTTARRSSFFCLSKAVPLPILVATHSYPFRHTHPHVQVLTW